MINKELFNWMCSGYVSYFSGGNPRNFPYKRIIEQPVRMGISQLKLYIRVLLNEVKDTPKSDGTDALDEQQKNKTTRRETSVRACVRERKAKRISKAATRCFLEVNAQVQRAPGP